MLSGWDGSFSCQCKIKLLQGNRAAGFREFYSGDRYWLNFRCIRRWVQTMLTYTLISTIVVDYRNLERAGSDRIDEY